MVAQSHMVIATYAWRNNRSILHHCLAMSMGRSTGISERNLTLPRTMTIPQREWYPGAGAQPPETHSGTLGTGETSLVGTWGHAQPRCNTPATLPTGPVGGWGDGVWERGRTLADVRPTVSTPVRPRCSMSPTMAWARAGNLELPAEAVASCRRDYTQEQQHQNWRNLCPLALCRENHDAYVQHILPE